MSFRDRSSRSGRHPSSSGSQGRSRFDRSGRDSRGPRNRQPKPGDLIGKYTPPKGRRRDENVIFDRDWRDRDRDRNPTPPRHDNRPDFDRDWDKRRRDNDWWKKPKKHYPDYRPPKPYYFDKGVGRDFHLGRYDFGRRSKHDWEWSGYRDRYYKQLRNYYRKLDKYRQRQYDIYRRQWRYFIPWLGRLPMASYATDCHWNIVNAARQGMAQIMTRYGINPSEISYISQYYGQQAADQYIAQRLGGYFQMYQQEVYQLQSQVSMMAQQCSYGGMSSYI